MVTQAIHSWSTVLERTAGFNAIAEVKSIDGPEMSLNAVDVTHLTSPNTFKEFIGGLRDGGEVTIEGNFYPGDTNGQIGLHNDLVAATVQDFRITFPTATGTTWTFKGLVTKFKTGAPLDEGLPFSVTIKITAKPALGVTASADATQIDIDEETGYGVPNVTVPTPFDGATYVYSCVINTASNWVTVKVQHATAAIITVHNSYNDVTTPLIHNTESGHLTIGAVADLIHTFTITVKVANKSPKSYTFLVIRP